MACQSIQQIDWLKGPMLPCATCAIGRHVARERSEEHTSELQSQSNLVCRLLLEKKKTKTNYWSSITKDFQPPFTTNSRFSSSNNTLPAVQPQCMAKIQLIYGLYTCSEQIHPHLV